jgi:hypothetical protein
MGALEANTTLIFGLHLRESANDGSDFTNAATDYRIAFLGEDGELHAKDSAGAVTTLGGGGGASVATVDATLGADVTMTNANTAYDGPSASFAAGTWLIMFQMQFTNGSNTQSREYTCKLWDGSTVYAEAQNDNWAANGNTYQMQVSGMAIVTLGSTTTLKVTALSIRSGDKIARDVVTNGAASHTATRLVGYKVT